MKMVKQKNVKGFLEELTRKEDYLRGLLKQIGKQEKDYMLISGRLIELQQIKTEAIERGMYD